VKRLKLTSTRGLGALIVSIIALVAVVVGTAGAAGSGPTTKTFAFASTTNNVPKTLFSVDGLTVNARCDTNNAPVIFAFTTAFNADLLGHVIDGAGHLHVIANDAFNKNGKGVSLAPAIVGDKDASGTLTFSTFNGKVVTITYGFDNSPTLSNKKVCTVYGSYIAT
jgi:hypothetical protein